MAPFRLSVLAMVFAVPPASAAPPDDTALLALRNTDGVVRHALSPDRQLLAVAEQDGTVHIWDLATRNAWRSFRPHRQYVTYLAFGADGKTLVTGSWDDQCVKTFRLSDLRGLETIDVQHRFGKENAQGFHIEKMVAELHGGRLPLDSFRAVLEFNTVELRGTDRGVDAGRRAVVSENGKIAVVVESDALSVWNLTAGRIARTIRFDPAIRSRGGVPFVSPDGKQAVIDRLSQQISADLEAGKLLHVLPDAFRDLYRGAAFSADGRTIALPRTDDQHLVLFDVVANKMLERDEQCEDRIKEHLRSFESSAYPIVAFGPRFVESPTLWSNRDPNRRSKGDFEAKLIRLSTK